LSLDAEIRANIGHALPLTVLLSNLDEKRLPLGIFLTQSLIFSALAREFWHYAHPRPHMRAVHFLGI
jgi:hypothetical protein